jgi:hypothetical protein
MDRPHRTQAGRGRTGGGLEKVSPAVTVRCMTTTTPTRNRFFRVLTAALIAAGALAAVPAGASDVPAAPEAGAPTPPKTLGPFDLYIMLTASKPQVSGLYYVAVMHDLSKGANRQWVIAEPQDSRIITDYKAMFETAITGERNGRPRKNVLYHVTGNVVTGTLCQRGTALFEPACLTRTYLQITTAKLLPSKCVDGYIHAKSWYFGRGAVVGLGVCGTDGAVYVAGGDALDKLRSPAQIRIDKLTFKATGKKAVTVPGFPGSGTVIRPTEPIALAVPVRGGTCTAKVGGMLDTANDGKPAKATKYALTVSFPC